MLRVGGKHFAIFGMDGARDKHAIPAGQAHGHHGCFWNRGGTVVHRRIGDFHAGELADHGLKFKDGGEGTLRNFGLIRRVGRQELSAGHHCVHQDGPVMMIDARAQERCITVGALVAARAKVVDDFVFRFSRRNVQAAG